MFSVYNKFFDPPQYRFQAVEDADHAVSTQTYDQALALYQQVISNDKLDWWTTERMEYILYAEVARRNKEPYLATPPTPDPNEYLYLVAYARYRIIVLHLLHGNEPDALVVYQTLLQKSPTGTPGSIYARMAQAFWENYATTHAIGQACGKSRVVAIENEEEATRYLIDDYANDGWGKTPYTLWALCPFY